MAAVLNLGIDAGATWRHALMLKQGGQAGPALELTGFTGRMHLRTHQDAPLALMVLTTENGRMLIDAAAGRIDLVLTAADTQELRAVRRAVYDVEIVSAGGDVTRIVQGEIAVSPDVTR